MSLPARTWASPSQKGGRPTAFTRPSAAAPMITSSVRTSRLAVLFGLATTAVLSLCLALLPASAWAHSSTFGDVPTAHPAHDAVEYLAGAGVVNGFEPGVFGPERSLTRAQAAKILVRQRGLSLPGGSTSRFKDVSGVYTPYIEAAAARSWIAGYPDGSFRPYNLLQRQHLAVVLVRSLGWESEALSLSSSEVASRLQGLSDAGAIATASRPHVALALSRGLMQGDGAGRFSPGSPATRAQFALAAYRAELRGLAVIQGVRFSADHPDKTRVVIDLSRAPAKVTTTPAAGSLTVELAGAVAPGGGATTIISSPEIDSVVSSQRAYRPSAARISVDLNRYSDFAVSALAPSDGKGHRLVVDVFRRTDGPPGSGPPLVTLDAGHGGSDPGAIGVTGLQEKVANLAITLEVDKILKAAGLRTLLTRTGDTYPTLEDRARLANEAKATIFVSVHNNAAGDPAAKGTETFYQGTAEIYSVEGRRLAVAIQTRLVASLGTVDRGARTHWKSLYVLSHTDMPAALAEVGFLTNAEEEARLKDPVYRARAGRAIAEGILSYLGWTYVPK